MRRLALLAALVILPASTPASGAASTAVVAKDDPVLAIVEDGGFRLVRLEPSSLTPSGRSVPLGRSAFSWSFSADGMKVAVGGQDGLRFVDTSAMRPLGRLSLPRRYEVASNGGVATFFGVQPLAWLAPRRVLVLAPPHELLVVDPVARRVVVRRQLGGWVGAWARTSNRLVLLVHSPERIAAPRVVVANAEGELRSVRLGMIVAGSRLEDAATHRTHTMMPGLAVDPAGGRAYVVGASGTVAEIGLARLTVAYHQPTRPRSLLERLHAWLEPEAQGKATSGAHREARWLGHGLLAVSGTDYSIGTTSGRSVQVSSPFGLRVIDTRSWTVRTIDDGVSSFLYSAGLLLGSGVSQAPSASGIGVVAYEVDGTRRFSLFQGEPARWAGAVGAYGYVRSRAGDGPGTRIVDLADGSVVHRVSGEPPMFLGDPSS